MTGGPDDVPFPEEVPPALPADDPIAAAAALRRRPADGGEQPTVDLGSPPLRRAAQTVAGLARANHPPTLFVRGGTLVRHRIDEEGRPILEDLNRDKLRAEANRRMAFERVTSKKDGTIDIKFHEPPADLLNNVLNLGEWEGVPPLAAVIEAPVLRGDGSVLVHPGYDPATRLLLHPSDGLERFRLPEPTAATVAAARTLLVDELLGDFPFTGQADRANAVALLLTPLVRHIVPVVPLAILTSPIKGTGKNFLASAVSIVATGREVEVYKSPGDDDEMRKALTAKLVAGSSIVFLDEAHELRSAALAAVLTAERHSDRRLGHTEEIRVPQRATWIAAGNNVTVAGDLDRRSYAIRMDPKMSRPWQRDDFRHPDLIAWTREHRWDLLAAALTLTSAWFRAGRPVAPVAPLGNFTPWAKLVGGVLHHAGIEGFLGNLAEHYDQAADESNAWEGLLLAAARYFENEGSFLTGELARLVRSDETLAELLPDHLVSVIDKERQFAQRLGKALRERVETRYGASGARLVVMKDTSRNASRWRVLIDEPALADEHSRLDAGSAGSAGPRQTGRGPHHSRPRKSSAHRESTDHAGSAGSLAPDAHTIARGAVQRGAETPGTPALPATGSEGGTT